VKNEKEITKYIDSISFLAGLFDVKIEVKPMPIQVDIRKTFLYKWGEEEGEKRGFEKGREYKVSEKNRRRINKSKNLGRFHQISQRLKFKNQKLKKIKKVIMYDCVRATQKLLKKQNLFYKT